MGAASGSRTLVATVLVNSLHYNNIEVIETGYGISLRPLSIFANDFYKHCNISRFEVKLSDKDAKTYTERDKILSARMHKAITVILFKLEGQKILRNPSFGMNDRLLLDKIDYENKCITIDGTAYPLEDTDFPTVDKNDPYTRFGRNSIEVGYLMEMVFPLYNIRFISINDDFDSDKLHGDTGGINVAFKYLVSEFYRLNTTNR